MMADDATPVELWRRHAEESLTHLMTRSKGSSSPPPRTTKTAFGESWNGVFDSKTISDAKMIVRHGLVTSDHCAAVRLMTVRGGVPSCCSRS